MQKKESLNEVLIKLEDENAELKKLHGVIMLNKKKI